MSTKYSKKTLSLWGYAYFFSMIWDFLIFEFALVLVNMFLIKKLGEKEEAFGTNRKLVSALTMDGIRETVS